VGDIVADERKVKQILLNLLSNAVRFTPEGGRVGLTATAADGALTIAVSDTGIGIAPEDQAAIYETRLFPDLEYTFSPRAPDDCRRHVPRDGHDLLAGEGRRGAGRRRAMTRVSSVVMLIIALLAAPLTAEAQSAKGVVPSTYSVHLVSIEVPAGPIDHDRHDYPHPHRPPPRAQNRKSGVAAPTGRPPAHRAASTPATL
jgi:Histidine kinase-, DNA gyrase B-, and HSP90-like ATPase